MLEEPSNGAWKQPIVAGGDGSDLEPERGLNSEYLHDADVGRNSGAERDLDLEQRTEPSHPISRLIWQNLLEEGLSPVQDTVERLETRQGQYEESIRVTMAQLTEQVAYLRQRVDTLEARFEAQRSDMEQAFELVQGELINVRQAGRQAERHEEMINRLRDENVHGAASLQRINEEQILILNQLLGRISGIQTDLSQQRRRLQGLLIAVTATAVAAVAVIIFLAVLYFVP